MKVKLMDLSARTKSFALRIIKVFSALPNSIEAQVLGKQLLRCGTSVGAHYREGVRARSKSEFVAKIDGGLQELEESCYWLELLGESGIVQTERLENLLKEANELIAILATISKRTKENLKK